MPLHHAEALAHVQVVVPFVVCNMPSTPQHIQYPDPAKQNPRSIRREHASVNTNTPSMSMGTTYGNLRHLLQMLAWADLTWPDETG